MTAVLVCAFAIQYFNVGVGHVTYASVFISGIFFLSLFLLMSFGIFCKLDSTAFTKTTYFFISKSISVRQISNISLTHTWFPGIDARTLIITSVSGEHITLTDVAYTRSVIMQVIRDLMEVNSSIKLDADTLDLLSSSVANKK